MVNVDQQQINQVADILPRLSRVMLESMMGFGERVVRERPGLVHSKAHLKVLMLLHRRGPNPVGEIANWLHISAPTASEHIDRMVDAGLVERSVNPADRRQVVVRLTDCGKELISPCAEYLDSRIRLALEQFDEDERRVVTQALEVFADAFDGATSCPFSDS